jgi:hypothetical protein
LLTWADSSADTCIGGVPLVHLNTCNDHLHFDNTNSPSLLGDYPDPRLPKTARFLPCACTASPYSQHLVAPTEILDVVLPPLYLKAFATGPRRSFGAALACIVTSSRHRITSTTFRIISRWQAKPTVHTASKASPRVSKSDHNFRSAKSTLCGQSTQKSLLPPILYNRLQQAELSLPTVRNQQLYRDSSLHQQREARPVYRARVRHPAA